MYDIFPFAVSDSRTYFLLYLDVIGSEVRWISKINVSWICFAKVSVKNDLLLVSMKTVMIYILVVIAFWSFKCCNVTGGCGILYLIRKLCYLGRYLALCCNPVLLLIATKIGVISTSRITGNVIVDTFNLSRLLIQLNFKSDVIMDRFTLQINLQ